MFRWFYSSSLFIPLLHHRECSGGSTVPHCLPLSSTIENVPVELREPLYRDKYEQEHLKPSVSQLLLSPELYCRTQALLHGVSQPAPQGPPGDNSALLQLLTKRGLEPRDQDVAITEEDLSHTPIKTVCYSVCLCYSV
jgi:hypothetical protein